MVIDNCLVSLPAALAALTVNVDVFAVVGVPEIAPAVESVKPVGNAPESRVHVMGVSPLAANVWLYAVFTVPLGNDVVVIVGAVGAVPSSPPPQAVKNPIIATNAIIPNIRTVFFM